MITHKFMLCESIPEHISIRNYNRAEMVIIDDDFVLHNPTPFLKVVMYTNDLDTRKKGLSYHGLSILDDMMAAELKKELLDYCHDCIDLRKMVAILDESINTKKYIIHFGV